MGLIYKHNLLIAAGALVLSVSWLAGGVPIYDGLGNPDEPYRYVQPPTVPKKTPLLPGSANRSYSRQELESRGGVFASSNEYGPQVAIVLDKSYMRLPAAATAITIKAVPSAPDTQPSSATIAGNYYRLSFITNAGPVSIQATGAPYTYKHLDLRLPQGFTAYPSFEYRPIGGAWHKITISQIGFDIYETDIQGPGDYALAVSKSQKSSKLGLIAAASVVVLIMTLAVTAIRRQAKKANRK